MNSISSTLIYKLLNIPFHKLTKNQLYERLSHSFFKIDIDELINKITELNPNLIFYDRHIGDELDRSRVVFFVGKFKYSTILNGDKINPKVSDIIEIYPNLYKSEIIFNYKRIIKHNNIGLVNSELKILDDEIYATDFFYRNLEKPIDKMISEIKKYFNIELTYQNIIRAGADYFIFMKNDFLIFKDVFDDNSLNNIVPSAIDQYCVINKSDIKKYPLLSRYFFETL